MFNVRWYKVLNDLLGNKTRTALIVLSITVGLFAIGMIASARIILSEEMNKSYAAIRPSSGVIRTMQTFDEDFVRSVRRMKGVADADARTHLWLRFQLKHIGAQTGAASAAESISRWRDLQIFAVPDYDAMRVNKIKPQQGDWPPSPRELLIERSSLDLIGGQIGDTLLIETGDHQVREMRIAGTVHDFAELPAEFDGSTYVYVSFDTLEWLGQSRGLNELHIVAQDQSSKQAVQRVINQVKDKVEKSGYVIPMSLSADPGQLPLNDLLQAILMLLGVLGLLSLFLSAFLIVNTISALVTQQVRQIGVMKAVGARAGQIVELYLALSLIYGVVALLLAVPLGLVGAQGLSKMMAGFFNFDVTRFEVAPQAIALQIVIGLLVPVLSALWPVMTVLRITAAEAMRNYGLGQDQYGAGVLDRLMSGNAALARMVSRPLILSLRNTFRRKGRLALTLITLTLGGMIFVGIFSVRASLEQSMNDLMGIYHFDLWVNLTHPQRIERVERQAMDAPGVVKAAGWANLSVRRVRTDGSESENYYLFAPPVEADWIHPAMLDGRWLRPDDQYTLVLTTGILENEPDLRVGDDIVLKIEGRKTTFRVVGAALGMGLLPVAYAGYADITHVTQEFGEVSSLMVVTAQHDEQSQIQTATTLEAYLEQAGSRIGSIQLMKEEMGEAENSFNLIILLALVMAFLLAIVGGMGLMGTLSINVLERTREIGVMRAIGAPDGAVAQVFIVEGIVIGVISWLLGVILSIPLGNLLSAAIGQAILDVPLDSAFSMVGAWVWLVVVIILSTLASFWPARNATRLTVRDVLAYE
jgi:putative ABC transport system permease protein